MVYFNIFYGIFLEIWSGKPFKMADVVRLRPLLGALRRESVVYICGSRQTPQRYRIEAKIDAIAEQEMTMRSNLEATHLSHKRVSFTNIEATFTPILDE